MTNTSSWSYCDNGFGKWFSEPLFLILPSLLSSISQLNVFASAFDFAGWTHSQIVAMNLPLYVCMLRHSFSMKIKYNVY